MTKLRHGKVRTTRLLSSILAIYAAIASVLAQQGDDPNFYECERDDNTYEWERLNFYEILGFSDSMDHSTLDDKDFRKAYRGQAQVWHPDKQRFNSTVSIDEVNARFARISQANEVLSDSQNREAYDRFLVRCEKPEKPFHRQEPHSSAGGAYNQERPIRSTVDEMTFQDPRTGAPILRKQQTDHFEDGYYRVLVQDFLMQTNSWGTVVYRPLQQHPYVLDEGYAEFDHQRPEGGQTTSDLGQGQYLREGRFLVSPNGRFRISVRNCELTIEERIGFEYFIHWQSDTFLPVGECFAMLQWNNLILAQGTPEYSGRLLWISDIDDDDDEFDFFKFFARLDNDGSFTIYRDDPFSGKKCTFATGPAGCNRIGRKLLHLMRIVNYFIHDDLFKSQ